MAVPLAEHGQALQGPDTHGLRQAAGVLATQEAAQPADPGVQGQLLSYRIQLRQASAHQPPDLGPRRQCRFNSGSMLLHRVPTSCESSTVHSPVAPSPSRQGSHTWLPHSLLAELLHHSKLTGDAAPFRRMSTRASSHLRWYSCTRPTSVVSMVTNTFCSSSNAAAYICNKVAWADVSVLHRQVK